MCNIITVAPMFKLIEFIRSFKGTHIHPSQLTMSARAPLFESHRNLNEDYTLPYNVRQKTS